ncbi:hypothetical protein pb186bvf_006515 [Paramecium bursaria]
MSNQRLSQSFPPTSQANFQYISESHELIQFGQCSDKITYRSIQSKKDLKQVKKLHQEWFPIQYQEKFYESALNGSNPSIVAEIEVQVFNRKEKIIIAALIYQIRYTKYKYMKWREIFCEFWKNLTAIYIMTIGVMNEFRGKGIAEKMIDQLKSQFLINPQLKYIYLDMVIYNEIGMKFYQKNGFQIVRTKRQHYNIESNVYDAYVYLWRAN